VKTFFRGLATASWTGVGFAFVAAALSRSALAFDYAPEIDPGAMGSAVALLSVGVMMLSGRRRRRA
jgi:hypothetical protein